MKIVFKTCALVSLLVLLPLSSHAGTQWVTGTKSCAVVCEYENSSPVQSGIYKNGHPFYVCRANAQGEGKRAGYNLRPDWDSSCNVAWGGKEIAEKSFDCLCVN